MSTRPSASTARPFRADQRFAPQPRFDLARIAHGPDRRRVRVTHEKALGVGATHQKEWYLNGFPLTRIRLVPSREYVTS